VATPETVKKYVALGFVVFVEASTGEGIGRSDGEYEQEGAEIVECLVPAYFSNLMRLRNPIPLARVRAITAMPLGLY